MNPHKILLVQPRENGEACLLLEDGVEVIIHATDEEPPRGFVEDVAKLITRVRNQLRVEIDR